MINLNEIAFIDIDGFDYNDGECLISQKHNARPSSNAITCGYAG